MDRISTHSTSARTAEADPIVLRESDQVRLVFIPTLVRNDGQPEACVRGQFIYQRKSKRGEWTPLTEESLARLKAGEGYRLELHSGEVLALARGLRPLYQLYRQAGIPRGDATFVKLELSLARFLALSEPDLAIFLDQHKDDAVKTLAKIVRWVAGAPDPAAVASQVATLAPGQLPAVTALLGLASMKGALADWEQNRANASEEFWQQRLAARSQVLSQVFAYPVLVVKSKAYVGGKQLDNRDGNVVDFLVKAEATGAVALIEIKTPSTKLLGQAYRQNVFPPSTELTGATMQVLNYRQTLSAEFADLTRRSAETLTLAEPPCIVIAGNASDELTNEARRSCFELWRQRLNGVTVVTYDELFQRVRRLVDLLEQSSQREA
jgi:hypothetical protein